MRAWLTWSLLVVSLIWGTPALCGDGADQDSGVPAKGMITMLDIGKGKCIPCKMMAPILEKLKKEYDGKASIVFIDISKDVGPAVKYGIRAIPTQIFFNEEGNEVYRHVGFMSENDITQQLEKMGVSRSSGNEGQMSCLTLTDLRLGENVAGIFDYNK